MTQWPRTWVNIEKHVQKQEVRNNSTEKVHPAAGTIARAIKNL